MTGWPRLSSGVQLISKPSKLHVPPWQLVSAALGGVSLRAATWWAAPKIPTTTASTPIACWDSALGRPGSVESESRQWSRLVDARLFPGARRRWQRRRDRDRGVGGSRGGYPLIV